MEITLLDNKYDPETTAMLQAFYSRNHKPIKVRLSEMGDNADSVKRGLEKWYVGYGHKSIGQCGTFTIFIENVSILAAKAIQDTPLYNGQETSTRYIDFSTQPMYLPFENDVQQKWLDFYTKHQQIVINHVAEQYNLNLNDKIEYKTAKARAFDILRGFLPAGCTTQLSWHTTFTHASDRLIQLLHHPLLEVRDIAHEIITQCVDTYPFAFAGIDKDIERYSEYYTQYAEELNYFNPDDAWCTQLKALPSGSINVMYDSLDSSTADLTIDLTDAVVNRIKGLMLPRFLNFSSHFTIEYLLDYGSYRDIQRHRNCTQMNPLLTTDYGFHEWYVNSLPKSIQKEAKVLIHTQLLDIEELREQYSDVDIQYLIPMGFKVPGLLSCTLPQLVYLAELRTSKTVHPTLRVIAKEFAKLAKKYVPIFDDTSDDVIDTRRGTQDIIEK